MTTPTPMKHALSQQGKTPSQSQHGAVGTPPVSTPFSAAHAASAFSPHGPRSSPQQVKKSPATTLGGHPSVPAVNFDSPSAAAALSALNMGSLDSGLSGFLGKTSEDERAKRLDAMIDILSVRPICLFLLFYFSDLQHSKEKASSAKPAWSDWPKDSAWKYSGTRLSATKRKRA